MACCSPWYFSFQSLSQSPNGTGMRVSFHLVLSKLLSDITPLVAVVGRPSKVVGELASSRSSPPFPKKVNNCHYLRGYLDQLLTEKSLATETIKTNISIIR